MINRGKSKKVFITSLLIYFIGITQSTHADINLPDKPLFIGGANVTPNIFLALDDSGSMNSEILRSATAAKVANGAYALFLDDAPVDMTPAFDDTEQLLNSCPGYNVMFYNPNIIYDPWPGKNNLGNDYPNQDISDAQDDPFYKDSNRVNLTNTDKMGNPSGYIPFDDDGDGVFEARECADDPNLPAVDYAKFITVGMMSTTEQDNYANWYSYYRSREHILKYAVVKIINDSSSRMGLGTLNNNGRVGIPIKDMTVAENREKLIKAVYRIKSADSTPLRLLLENSGKYFDQAGNDADHHLLGFIDPSPIVPLKEGGACQQNFTLLMSDGYWNGTKPNVGNTDAGTGPYDGGPHADAYENTLADVAMHYYETDLSPLSDVVPENQYTDSKTNVVYTDNNPQQHMVTYTVAFGLSGNNLKTPRNHKLTTPSPPWTEPMDLKQSTKLDDMQHAAFNGRGLFLSAKNPQQLVAAINKSMNNIEKRNEMSGSAIAINSTVLKTTSKIFQASFNSNNWTGELSAYSINDDGTIGTEIWNATDNFPNITDPDDRNIFTNVSIGGIAFDDFPGNGELNAAIGTLDVDAKTYIATDIIHYISGMQTNEGIPSGLRERDKILGDIVSSSPVSIGYQNLGYDLLQGYSGDEGTLYSKFLGEQQRLFTDIAGDPQTVIYVGANDGMLHAFHDSESVADDGRELFAYIPGSLHGRLKDLASPDYSHQYYINGNHSVGHACFDDNGINCTWKSILVGSLGEGGRTIYALDVSDPFNFDETNVLWEYSFDDTRAGTANSQDMGFIKGAPQIVRLNNGKWGVVFANGYNSDSKTAKLFILDVEDGTEIAVIDTLVGGPNNENGLATPLVVDVTGDRVADMVYAGDLLGNLFKINIADSDPDKWDSKWRLASGTKEALPLFQALDKDGNTQPITTKPTIVTNPEGGFIIVFGTGKYLENSDIEILSPYQTQTMYGIWDDKVNRVAGRKDLQEQAILEVIDTGIGKARIISANEIIYDKKDDDTKRGWYLDALLPGLTESLTGERVIADPTARFGRAIFVNFIPPSNPCNSGGISIITEIDAMSGAALEDAVFDSNGDGIIDENDYVTDNSGNKVPVSGIYIPGTISSPTIIALDSNSEVKQFSGVNKETTTVLESTDPQLTGRQSWKQLK